MADEIFKRWLAEQWRQLREQGLFMSGGDHARGRSMCGRFASELADRRDGLPGIHGATGEGVGRSIGHRLGHCPAASVPGRPLERGLPAIPAAHAVQQPVSPTNSAA